MEIRIAGTVNDSYVDGPGCRYSIFTQGCPHHCPGCHNPQSHDFQGGRIVDTDDIIRQMRENPMLDGITLTGGEPFCQPEACRILVEEARALKLNVWSYSGWTYEELLASGDPARVSLLCSLDVLVDGRFVLEERSLSLQWRGSRNQRLVDVQKSLSEGRVCLWEQPVVSWDAL